MGDRVRMWCLRHGESENVTAGVAAAVPSAPLTGRGRRQPIQAAQILAGEWITGVHSSTALRGRQTAQLLAARFGLEVSALPSWPRSASADTKARPTRAVHRRAAEVLAPGSPIRICCNESSMARPARTSSTA